MLGDMIRIRHPYCWLIASNGDSFADFETHKVLANLQGAVIGLPGLGHHVVEGRRRFAGKFYLVTARHPSADENFQA